jgi:hypothetical protein
VRTIIVVALLSAAVFAGSAHADGLPVLGVDVGSDGVTTQAAAVRYVTIADGAVTIVAQTKRHGGSIVGLRRLRGSFTVPAVAYDGSASGLSADGRVLVLIQPRQSFPRANTTFALLDAPGLHVGWVFTLRGDFSFDALSPDGSTMFLVQYVDPSDPDKYAVRAYDLAAGRLLAAPVVDPRERGAEMRGKPLTRTTSADGRWAYTLYDGGGGTPFVHALDTEARTAHCIDLPQLVGRPDLWQLRLERIDAGRALRVGDAVTISTRDFAVVEPRSRGALPAVAGASVVLALLLGWLFTGPTRRGARRPDA